MRGTMPDRQQWQPEAAARFKTTSACLLVAYGTAPRHCTPHAALSRTTAGGQVSVQELDPSKLIAGNGWHPCCMWPWLALSTVLHAPGGAGGRHCARLLAHACPAVPACSLHICEGQARQAGDLAHPMAKGVFCTAVILPGVPLTRVTHDGNATSLLAVQKLSGDKGRRLIGSWGTQAVPAISICSDWRWCDLASAR